MDDVTRRRHRTNPDYRITFTATGVKLPNNTVSWSLHKHVDEETAANRPEITKPLWWARVLTEWARSFLHAARKNTTDPEKS